MKTFFMAFVLVVSMGCSATNEHTDVTKDFTGVISTEALIAEYPQFQSVYESYEPTEAEITAIKSIEGKSIMVLFGTWCHDSEREVPRLLKLLERAGVTLKSLSLVGVDRNKQEPGNRHSQFELRYTPTIILLDGNKELGRVIERPQVSLGEDLQVFVSLQ
ncbi:MAG: thioredoxin family protein [Paraglaciecola sp.]|uniref:thioredoxin family protein n=1 Tax=Paraglaciecola sp. TaxID=1920173 RepID=UPI003299541A